MKSTTRPAKSAPVARPAHDEIARRAYELWLQDGCPTGRDSEHWQAAERELSGLNTGQSQGLTETPLSRREKEPSIAASEDVSSPFAAFEKDAPLATKVERRLAGTHIKAGSRSPTSIDID